MRFTPMLRSPMPSNLKVLDSQCNGGMLIDSDTTYTHLPEPFQSAITYPWATDVEMQMGSTSVIEFHVPT
ncbi:hypothetical protein V6N13_078091 [Hibiscus sabdariffa]